MSSSLSGITYAIEEVHYEKIRGYSIISNTKAQVVEMKGCSFQNFALSYFFFSYRLTIEDTLFDNSALSDTKLNIYFIKLLSPGT